jgi:hypothetical protein
MAVMSTTASSTSGHIDLQDSSGSSTGDCYTAGDSMRIVWSGTNRFNIAVGAGDLTSNTGGSCQDRLSIATSAWATCSYTWVDAWECTSTPTYLSWTAPVTGFGTVKMTALSGTGQTNVKYQEYDVTECIPSVTPSKSVTPSTTISASSTRSQGSSQSASPSKSESASQTPSTSISASVTPSTSVTASVTPSQTASVSVTSSVSPTASTSPSPSISGEEEEEGPAGDVVDYTLTFTLRTTSATDVDALVEGLTEALIKAEAKDYDVSGALTEDSIVVTYSTKSNGDISVTVVVSDAASADLSLVSMEDIASTAVTKSAEANGATLVGSVSVAQKAVSQQPGSDDGLTDGQIVAVTGGVVFAGLLVVYGVLDYRLKFRNAAKPAAVPLDPLQ